MELQGKKVAFLGDSITEGCGTSGVDKVYWSLIGQRTGAQVYGYGVGGTKIAKPRVMGLDAVSDQYFASRVDARIPDADIVVVDLYATCPIQPRAESLKACYMPDGLHPNDAGHMLIANRLLSTLNTL